jgi:probable rRNA maturation factor
MNTGRELQVACRGIQDGVPSARLLSRWARAALGRRGHGKELVVQVVASGRMRRLNNRYRGKDNATNVLAFPVQSIAPVVPQPLGDVVICPVVLRREAREQGKSERAHWAHLIVHGALHLVGYDHEQVSDARRMERREVLVLRTLGFANPYTVQGTH